MFIWNFLITKTQEIISCSNVHKSLNTLYKHIHTALSLKPQLYKILSYQNSAFQISLNFLELSATLQTDMTYSNKCLGLSNNNHIAFTTFPHPFLYHSIYRSNMQNAFLFPPSFSLSMTSEEATYIYIYIYIYIFLMSADMLFSFDLLKWQS